MIPDELVNRIYWFLYDLDDSTGVREEACALADEIVSSQPQMPEAPWDDAPEEARWAIVRMFIQSDGSDGFDWQWCQYEPKPTPMGYRPIKYSWIGPAVDIPPGIDYRGIREQKPETDHD